jgi:hypothetical protein
LRVSKIIVTLRVQEIQILPTMEMAEIPVLDVISKTPAVRVEWNKIE